MNSLFVDVAYLDVFPIVSCFERAIMPPTHMYKFLVLRSYRYWWMAPCEKIADVTILSELILSPA